MKNLPRLIFLLAVVLLLGLFVFPMWSITLIAPQYPDGVTMYIWINKITGSEPGTLQNINILNHYVGMKYIEPDTIPELKYFQYIILAMVAFGLVVFWRAKRQLYLLWTIILTILCVLGIYDFYLWEYDYGHNLSPTAPIKIPGMAYQPPLIGSKELLNFLAISLPDISGWMVGGSLLLGMLAFYLQLKRDRNDKKNGIVVTNKSPHQGLFSTS